MGDGHFTPDAYEIIRAGAQRSAGQIVPRVLEHAELGDSPTICDVGCGEGWFAREFARAGCSVLAIDETVDVWRFEAIRDGGRVDFMWVDLTSDGWAETAALERSALADVHGGKATTDLAVCLEVAEHLSAETANALVAGLCELAPVVLFSAAIPGQGGLGHLNEQWPDYWAGLFHQFGFEANEDLRGALWDDVDVESWYRQNLLLYAFPDWMDERALPHGVPHSIVHPDLFAARVSERDAAWAKLRENGIEP